MRPNQVSTAATDQDVMQIGELADRIGLSLRTIRYYGEVGLVPPTARSDGGFRLYTESDLERFVVIKRMKPLGFSLDEMREVLDLLDVLADPDTDPVARRTTTARLAVFGELAQERIAELRQQLSSAEALARTFDSSTHDIA